MKSLMRMGMALVLCAAVMLATACSTADFVKWADTAASVATRAQPAFQSLIDGGVIPRDKGAAIIGRVIELGADAKTVADAFRSNNTSGAVEATAKAIKVVEQLINQDAQLIPAGAQRTTVLAILAAADIALGLIADNLSDTAKSSTAVRVMASRSDAAQTVASFAHKPRLRARDARTGRFVTLDYAQAHPDTTVVERVSK